MQGTACVGKNSLNTIEKNTIDERRNLSMNEATNMNEERDVSEDRKEKSTFHIVVEKRKFFSIIRKWKISSLLSEEFLQQVHMILLHDTWAVIATTYKRVYTIGLNDNGQLGIPSVNSSHELVQIDILAGKNIKLFFYNDYFWRVYALTEEGEVYYWGMEVRRDLDAKFVRYVYIKPTWEKVLSNKVIIDIAQGFPYNLFLTCDGKVFGLGEIKPWKIKRGNRKNKRYLNKYTLRQYFIPEKVVNISCGFRFNVVVTNNHKVYSWGCNEYGQLGRGENLMTSYSVPIPDYYSCPHEVTALSGKNIVKVVCGMYHVLALTDDGKVYAWGQNYYGQLGIGNQVHSPFPVMVDRGILGRVVDIASFYTSRISVAINDNGCVYVWGDYMNENIKIPIPTLYSNMHEIFAYNNLSTMLIMPKKHKYVDEKLNILKVLKSKFNDQRSSDLTIKVRGQPIYVHKGILKLCSTHFKSILTCNSKESNQSVIEICEYSYDVYKAFLKYCYTGTIDLPEEEALELLYLAITYKEPKLQLKCMEFISSDNQGP